MASRSPVYNRVLAKDFSHELFTKEDAVSIRRQLGESGAALVSIDEGSNKAEDSVKQIFQTDKIIALEETSDPTPLQTNLPLRAEPPRLSAIRVVEGDSVVVALARFSKVVSTIQPLLATALRSDLVIATDEKPLPILDTSYRGRLSPGLLDDSSLPDVHVEFISGLKDEILLPRNRICVKAGSVLVFDNRYFAHSILPSSGPFKAARFCFEPVNPPELDAALASAATHVMWGWEGEPGVAALDLAAWPLRIKSEFYPKMSPAYREHYYSGGTKGLYWSISSGSTRQGNKIPSLPSSFISAESEATVAFVDKHLPFGRDPLIPSSFPEVNEQRLMLSDLYADSGAFDSTSTFLSSFVGFRAPEVQTHAFYNLSITHFPVGGSFTTEEYIAMMLTYGVTHMVGMASAMLEMAIYIKRHEISIPSLRGFLLGGEDLSERGMAAIGKITRDPENPKIVGIWGSSEVGVFAVRNPGDGYYQTWADGMILEIVDDDGNPVPVGQVGELVQTNVMRRREPMVRFTQGDMARFVDDSRTKFIPEGRKHDALYCDFIGGRRVFWSDVKAALLDYLDESFDGFQMHQLVISPVAATATTGEAQDVALTVYTYEKDESVLQKVADGALKRLEGVLPRDECGVRDMRVEWIDDPSKFIRVWTGKLVQFAKLSS